MNNKKEFLNNLGKSIKHKKYEYGIKLLEKEIKDIFIGKIKEKYFNFEYTNMINMLEIAENALDIKSFQNLKRFYMILNEDNNELYEIEILMNIYKLEVGEN